MWPPDWLTTRRSQLVTSRRQNQLFSQDHADIEDRDSVRAAWGLHGAVVAGPSAHERRSECRLSRHHVVGGVRFGWIDDHPFLSQLSELQLHLGADCDRYHRTAPSLKS